MIGDVIIPPRQKLEDLIRLAELCVDLLRQNEEFYAEVIFSILRLTQCCTLYVMRWRRYKVVYTCIYMYMLVYMYMRMYRYMLIYMSMCI